MKLKTDTLCPPAGRIHFPVFPFAAPLTLLATACSDSGGTPAPPPPPPPASVSHLHVYLEETMGVGIVKFVDPRLPSQPMAIGTFEPGNFDFNPVLRGALDPASGVLQAPRVEGLAFGTGLNVIEVPLGAGAPGSTFALAPVKTLSAPIAELDVHVDAGAAEVTKIYVAELNSGEHVTFEWTEAGTTAELVFPGVPVANLTQRGTGLFDGWLGLESNMLTRVQRDLTVTNLAPAFEASYVDVTEAGDAFVFLGDRYAAFRQDGTLTDVAYTPVSSGSFNHEDLTVVGADALYFCSSTSLAPGAATFEVVRALSDGSAVAITGDINGTPEFITVTDTRVLVGYYDLALNGDSIVSMDLTGGSTVMLEMAAQDVDASAFRFPGTSSDRIVYQLQTAGLPSVIDIADDGTDRQEYPMARLVGLSIGGNLTFHSATNVEHIFLATPSTTGSIRLESAVPGDPSTRVTLGLLPMEFDDVSVTTMFSETAVVTAIDTTVGNERSDVFLVRAGRAGSLDRVTDNPGEFSLGLL